jgi:hypothetical protein
MPNEFKIRNGLIVTDSGSTVLAVDGASGRLFSVDDTLSGSLFSVNTAAGLPVMEAFSDNTVRIGQFGRRVLFVSQSFVGIGKETGLNTTLDVSGSFGVTGSVFLPSLISQPTNTNVVTINITTGQLAYTASSALGGGSGVSSNISMGSVTASVSSTNPTASFRVTSGSNTLLTLTKDARVVIGTPGEFIDYQLEVSGAIKADYLYCDSNGSIASSLYGIGQLLTDATEQPVVYLESTWNTTAAARGIEYRVTNTASSGSSKLLNLFVDSVSMFNVNRAGVAQVNQALALPPQSPLPSDVPTGSIASSGSGADCKPYFWNGSTWTPLF